MKHRIFFSLVKKKKENKAKSPTRHITHCELLASSTSERMHFCVSSCVPIHWRESDTVSLPGWQAAVSLSCEWKPIWQITSSRQSTHPSTPLQACCHCSVPVTITLLFPLPVLLCVTPPNTHTHFSHFFALCHHQAWLIPTPLLFYFFSTHNNKKHTCNPGPPFLFARQNRWITVIDFHVAGTSGKLFEGLCCDEYLIWDQRSRGRRGGKWMREEMERWKKKRLERRKCWPCSQALCFDSFYHLISFFPFVFSSLYLHPWLRRSLATPLCLSLPLFQILAYLLNYSPFWLPNPPYSFFFFPSAPSFSMTENAPGRSFLTRSIEANSALNKISDVFCCSIILHLYIWRDRTLTQNKIIPRWAVYLKLESISLWEVQFKTCIFF